MSEALALQPIPAARDDVLIPAVGEGGLLYPIAKLEAHRRGVLHLAVSVFAFSQGKLLIQQRAAAKYHSGGQWANTVCTHPHWRESPDVGARRRLFEELGVDADVTPAGRLDYYADVGSGLVEHERVQVYRADLARDVLVRPNPDEVSAVRWATPAELDAEATAFPYRFAPWFRIYLARWPDLGLD